MTLQKQHVRKACFNHSNTVKDKDINEVA